MTDASDRAYDIVVFGASGFAGRVLAAHLAAHAPAALRIALAGRSDQRLRATRIELGPRAARWPLRVVDAADDDAVAALAADAAVVATTVGPYARYGRGLVAACVDAGTDYVDITGEALFIRDVAAAHHDRAREAGVRIVHSCGFDSVPSDLSVLLAARAAAPGELVSATMLLRSAAGGLGGGTVETLRQQLDDVVEDRSRARAVVDPYTLSPDRAAEPDLGPQPDMIGPTYDAELDRWLGPFVMATHNTRIVRRSNALLGWAYGRRLRYREAVDFGRRRRGALGAAGVATALAVLPPAMRFGPTRTVLDRLSPDPGTGPDEATRAAGHFRMELHAVTATGGRIVVTFVAPGDPGYAATAAMLGQSALALVVDRDALPDAAGVLTPATGIGGVLVDRLRAAGFTIRVERDD